jgi:hypothetical protein
MPIPKVMRGNLWHSGLTDCKAYQPYQLYGTEELRCIDNQRQVVVSSQLKSNLAFVGRNEKPPAEFGAKVVEGGHTKTTCARECVVNALFNKYYSQYS